MESNNENKKINKDLNILISKLRTSNEKETYYAVSRSKYYQIGVGRRIDRNEKEVYTIEFSFCALDTSIQPKSTALKTASWATKKLEKNGYTLNHLDDGWISGEKTLLQSEITKHYEALIGLLDEMSEREGDGS